MQKSAIFLFSLLLAGSLLAKEPRPVSDETDELQLRPPVSLNEPGAPVSPGESDAQVPEAISVADEMAGPSEEYDDVTMAELPEEAATVATDASGRSQIACAADAGCKEFVLGKATAEEVSKAMQAGVTQILVTAGRDGVELKHEPLQPLRAFLKGIAERKGRVSVEPVYVAERGVSPFFVKDVISVSWSIFAWIRDGVVYRHTKHYHGKVVYHPVTGKVLLVNFVHRDFGDICTNLISRCDVIEYVDERTFDLTLARRLKESRGTGRPVQVRFRATPAHLPKGELSGENLGQMNRSTRIYKWLVAAREARRQPLVRQRVITTPVAVALVDISITAYKMIRDLLMYRVASDRDARVYYVGAEAGGEIRSVIFTPAPAE